MEEFSYLGLLRQVIIKRRPELLHSIEDTTLELLSTRQNQELIDLVGDELFFDGIQQETVTPYGEQLEKLLDYLVELQN